MDSFRFIGKLEFNAMDSKNPYLRIGKTGKGNDYFTISFSVVPAKNNRAYVECFGMVTDKIKTKDSNGAEKIVAWEDRLSEEVIKDVARYRRWSVKLDGTYHEFITAYDFIKFCNENLEKLKEKVFVVTGGINTNVYNGKISFRYQVQSIREVAEDENFDQKLTVKFTTFFRKEDIDLDEWKSNKAITINAFSHNYVKDANGNKYIPTTLHINLVNEDNDKRAAFFLKQFGIIIEDGNAKIKIKDKEVASLPVKCDYINGNEEVPFDESQLTDNQKEMIELGLKTLDDFKPSGSIYGQKVARFYATDVDTRDDYADGYKVEQITAGEFETEIFAPAASEANVDEIKDNEDIDALFGT